MLLRLGRSAAPREEMKRAFALHLEKLQAWLKQQPNMDVLDVCYHDLIDRPKEQSLRVGEFLRGGVNVENMVKAVDQGLYRNRKT